MPAAADDLRDAPPISRLGALFQAPSAARAKVDYSVRMNPYELDALGMLIQRELIEYQNATANRAASVEGWRRDWEMQPVAPTATWRNSAQINSYFTHLYCKNHTSRLNGQLTAVDPPLAVVARAPEAIDAAPKIEEAMAASLEESKWVQHASDLHTELPLTGNAWVRVTYEEEHRRVPRLEFDIDEELFGDLLELMVPWDVAYEEAVQKEKDGTPRVFLTWKNELKSSGVKYRVLPWEDGFILPAAVQRPEDARGIGEWLTLRGDELKAGAASGRYLPDQVEKILKYSSDSIRDRRQDRVDSTGTDSTAPREVDPNVEAHRLYEMAELNYLWDANGDGELELLILGIHVQSGIVFRAQYCPYEHGCPYYHLLRYIVRPGELWGMGIAELIATLHDAHTALLNQIINSGDLALAMRGNFFYKRDSGFKPDKFVMELGRPIPVDDPSGVVPMQFQPLSPEHYMLHQTLKDMGDQLTATSNPGLGQTTDASKTLGEVQLVSANANAIFEEIARGVGLQEAELWDQHRFLLAQYAPKGVLRYKATANPGIVFKEAMEMAQAAMGQPGMAGMPPLLGMPAMPGMGGAPGMGMDPNAEATPGIVEGSGGAGTPDPSAGAAPAGAAAGMPGGPGGMPGMQPGMMHPGMMAGMDAMGGMPGMPIPDQVQFREISADLLRESVDIIPTGLKALGDAQSRMQHAQLFLQTMVEHPLTADNVPVQILALDYWLQAHRYPQREKVLIEVYKAYMQAMFQTAQTDRAKGEEAGRTANQDDADRQAAREAGKDEGPVISP